MRFKVPIFLTKATLEGYSGAGFGPITRMLMDVNYKERAMRAPFYGPTIVCLCGSTRFKREFQEANLEETLAGRIVLSVGSFVHSDEELGGKISPEIKDMLDQLHKHKIDLADEILVLNVGGYVGESTASEILHARATGKRVRWLGHNLQSGPHITQGVVAEFLGDQRAELMKPAEGYGQEPACTYSTYKLPKEAA